MLQALQFMKLNFLLRIVTGTVSRSEITQKPPFPFRLKFPGSPLSGSDARVLKGFYADGVQPAWGGNKLGLYNPGGCLSGFMAQTHRG